MRPRRAHGCATLAAIAVLVQMFACTSLEAHERSESYSHWTYSEGGLSGVVTIRAREATRLTLPGEGFDSLAAIFTAHVEKTLSATVDARPCELARPPHALESDRGYIRVGIEMHCPSGSELRIHSDLFFDAAPAHDHFIYVEGASGAGREAILTVSSRTVTLELKAPSTGSARFWQFILMGIEHIGSGIDHLAFLLALLLTARTARQVLIVVTGFTLGHSLTLSLAAVGLIQANRTAIEALIGLTIALAAAGNLIRGEREGRMAALAAAAICLCPLLIPAVSRPDMPAPLLAAIALGAAAFVWMNAERSDGSAVGSRFAMALGFGLIHGLGFANALQDLDLPRRMLVPTLVGFNIGVEIGQLSAVLLGVTILRGAGRIWRARPAAGSQSPGAPWRGAPSPPAARSDAPAVVMSAALLAAGTAWFLIRSVTFGD
jgi:HupE / UreJ protein